MLEQAVKSTHRSTQINRNDYAALKARISEAGLLEEQGTYYAIKLAYTIAMFAMGVALMFLLSGWTRVLVLAPYMAFVSTQLGFLAHDLGHKQVFQRKGGGSKRGYDSTRINDWLGMLVANLMVGMSLGWWNDKHNAHHANPNHDGLDPDIDIPFMVFSEDQAMSKSGISRAVAAYQAFLFFPALTLTVYSMQAASAVFTLRERYRRREPDAVMLWAHIAIYYAGIPLLLGLWQGLVFILLHRGLLGLMVGSVFAPNHKGMLVIGKDDDRLDFLRKQVLTARNVRSTPLIDFLYGGLNHQAVHHLFPNMPRNKLQAAEEITSRFCEEQSIPYHVTGVRQSFKEILESLSETSAPLRLRAAS